MRGRAAPALEKIRAARAILNAVCLHAAATGAESRAFRFDANRIFLASVSFFSFLANPLRVLLKRAPAGDGYLAWPESIEKLRVNRVMRDSSLVFLIF